MPTTEPKKSASQKLVDEVTDTGIDDVDLSGAPALRPPVKLRPGRKAKLFRVYEHLKRVESESMSSADMLELVDEAVEALEPFALSADEFDAWVTEDDNLDKIIPLYIRHMERMGESTRSAT